MVEFKQFFLLMETKSPPPFGETDNYLSPIWGLPSALLLTLSPPPTQSQYRCDITK